MLLEENSTNADATLMEVIQFLEEEVLPHGYHASIT